MRRIPLRYLKENSITAIDIYNSSGKLLISKSMKIDKNMMELLHKNKIIYVYIMDESREDIIDDVISPELRREAVLELKKMSYEFSNLTSIKRNKEINNVYIEKILNLVNRIIDELLKKNSLTIEQIDIRDFENQYFQHSVNVAIISLIIGIELNYDIDKLRRLGIAAILHDLGYAFLPKEIIYKSTKLSNDEEEVVKTHSEKGYNYLYLYTDVSRDVLFPILYHHEHVDGSGYPRGIKGNRINEYSKIIAIVDFYDKLVNSEVILQSDLPNNILERIMAHIGTAFDYKIVEVFYKKAIPFLKGTMLKLSNADIVLVEGTINGFPSRPIVRVLQSDDNSKINKCINLVDVLNISIDKIIYYL